MATARDGHPDPTPRRRFRPDNRRGAGPADALGPRHSGRVFVTAAALTVLLIWGLLSLAFLDWRSRYRARAAFGRREVAPVVDPLFAMVPPGVAPDDWRGAVATTRLMLEEVTAS